MDALDEQIVHCLNFNGRASFRQVADVVGVSEQTVSRRFARMREAGTLRVVTLPNRITPGTDNWFLRMTCRPDTSDRLADALAARPDVSWLNIGAGGSELSCLARVESGRGGHSGLLQRLPQTSQVLTFTASSILYGFVGGLAEWHGLGTPLSTGDQAILRAESSSRPGTGVRITADDQPLVDALARDGRASVVAIAKETGWPVSRVSNRLQALLASEALVVDVDLRPEAFGYATTAYLWLTVAPGELHATGQALAEMPESAFTAAVTGSANLMTSVMLRSPAELYKYVTSKVGSLGGVRQIETVPVFRRVKLADSLVREGRVEPVTTGPRPRRTAAR